MMKQVRTALILLLATNATAQFDGSRIFKGKAHEKQALESETTDEKKDTAVDPEFGRSDADALLSLSMQMSMSVPEPEFEEWAEVEVPADSMSMTTEQEPGEWGAFDNMLMSLDPIDMISLSFSYSNVEEEFSGKPQVLQKPGKGSNAAESSAATLAGKSSKAITKSAGKSFKASTTAVGKSSKASTKTAGKSSKAVNRAADEIGDKTDKGVMIEATLLSSSGIARVVGSSLILVFVGALML